MNKLPRMNKLPASDNLLESVCINILEKSQQGINTSLLEFSGSGKPSHIKYLIRNIGQLPFYNKKHLFLFLDLKTLITSFDVALKELISFIPLYFSEFVASELLEKSNKLGDSKYLDPSALISLFHEAIVKYHHNITIIVDHSDLIFESKKKNRELLDAILTIKRVNPMGISFIFLNAKDFDLNNLSVDVSENFLPMYLQNQVFLKDTPFDLSSTKRLFSNMSEATNHVFKEEFIKKVSDIALPDPSIIKTIAQKAVSDSSFQDSFLKEEDSLKLYVMIGKEVLEVRYMKIINNLSSSSLRFILGDISEPTEYLINSGIVYKDKNTYVLLNPLFEMFVQLNKEKLNGILSTLEGDSSTREGLDSEVLDILSGKELKIFRLLDSKKGEVVSRDDIAKAIWGDNSESEYSDWALDQSLSRLRSKLRDIGYTHTIKTLKGDGVMFI